MFKKIINNTLLISASALTSGLIYKYLKNIYDENSTMKKNQFTAKSNSIFNSGMLIGTLIGITCSYLKCPVPLHKTLQLKN
tara:strand:- start:36544 stop:36786 length:243 start_codon:yes stop_codon:yes gene_type:complete